MDGPAETERREHLHELDSLLDALEQLNLQESNQLPPQLRQRLEAVGVTVPANTNVTELIERVWEVQERYLGNGGVEAGAR